MRVATKTALFLTDNEAGLAVRLQASEAVDDVGASLFELTCPFDVIQLVETGTEFDQCRDLLAVASGFFECFNHG